MPATAHGPERKACRHLKTVWLLRSRCIVFQFSSGLRDCGEGGREREGEGGRGRESVGEGGRRREGEGEGAKGSEREREGKGGREGGKPGFACVEEPRECYEGSPYTGMQQRRPGNFKAG